MQATPEFIIKGAIEGADYSAIKFMKNKNQAHNTWYKSVLGSARILEDFVKKEYPMGLPFNHKGSGSWADVMKGGSGPSEAQTAPPQAPQQHSDPGKKPAVNRPPKK